MAAPLAFGAHVCYTRLLRASATRVSVHARASPAESRGRARTLPRAQARDAVPYGHAQSLRPVVARCGRL